MRLDFQPRLMRIEQKPKHIIYGLTLLGSFQVYVISELTKAKSISLIGVVNSSCSAKGERCRVVRE